MLRIFIVLSFVLLTGCRSSVPRDQIVHDAAQARFSRVLIQTKTLRFTSYQKHLSPSEPITIYIEGDGKSWLSKHKISPNPTPRHPLALALAIEDPSPNVVYLARPCQYTENDPYCHPDVWTWNRFSRPIVEALNEAVTQIMKRYPEKKIHLVGFSGGGTIATLIAGMRRDVQTLRTVAGDLDPVSLGRYHHTTPLVNGLNPMDMVSQIKHLPQRHFSGAKDEVVPVFIAEQFVAQIKADHCAENTVVPFATHHEGWVKAWPHLLRLPVQCH